MAPAQFEENHCVSHKIFVCFIFVRRVSLKADQQYPSNTITNSVILINTLHMFDTCSITTTVCKAKMTPRKIKSLQLESSSVRRH